MSRAHRLMAVLVLNLGLVAALVAVAVTAHSLAVLAEGGDYLLDAAGIGVALLAIRLARPSSRGCLSGRPNATNVAALINSAWLLVLELLVTGAAAYRLVFGTSRVNGLPVLIVSGIAALVMTAGALILHGDPDDKDATRVPDLSVAAVLLDTIADAAAAAGVAVAGAIILVVRGWYWLDPAVALAIAAIVSCHALVLIHKIISRLKL
ncbi:MAG: cation transporter [Streptosporangiaceae bacterium]